MDWRPTLNDRRGPLYEQLVEALAADIEAGRLLRGQRLPTHRALARTLGIDLTTVTRAYGEARRRGLTEARVGQGTFVAESRARAPRVPGAAAGATFDLSMNLPPEPVEADLEGRIVRGFDALRRERGLSDLLSYRQPGGSEADRRIAADWLVRRVPTASPGTVLIAPGTQSALAALLQALLRPGDVLLTDRLTYPGLKAAAEGLGVGIAGVAGDTGGMDPAALDEACRRLAARAVYLMPTIHNPTTVTLTAERRQRLAAVIRRRDLWLIEDDAYGELAPDALPVACLMPERSYLAATFSKIVAPGLRVSLLVVPDRRAAAEIGGALRAVSQMAAPLMVALVLRWLADGSADAIVGAIRAEAAARQALAARLLAGLPFEAHPHGHHLWLPLPAAWSRADFAVQMQRRGLALVTGDSFAVDDAPAHAVRLALGAARNRSELAAALDLLAAALRGPPPAGRVV